MFKKRATFSALLVGAVLVACTSQGTQRFTPNAGSVSLPPIDQEIGVTANLPARTVGEELPGEGLGSYDSKFWHAVIGGFTQTQYSQTLGFPPGTKITLRNLSKTTPHTLDVVAKILKPPAHFPANPSLKTTAEGHGILAVGYASGVLEPGKSVTVTLSKPGIYLVGCAFHYKEGMHDVFVVGQGAKPGQQATPMPHATTSPSSRPTIMPSYR